MKKLMILVIILARTITANGQCTPNYSWAGTTDTLSFTNLSSVSNAHYYWNFGDGSGSNDFSPTHAFPDDGKYLVTLYSVDTLTNCADFYQNWIDVTKPDTFQCDVVFSDTIIGSGLQTTNLSSNCSGLYLNCHVAGPAENYCGGVGLEGWFSSLFIHGMEATSSDSIYGYRIFNAYYKTVPWNYSSDTNYQNCSANFEVIVDYQPNYAVATFKAMNKNATSYTFYITGFGNPIPLNGQSVSYNFNYVSYRRISPTNVYLIISDTVNNCTDSVDQQILIKNPYYTYPVNCVIYSPPQIQTATIGSNVQFFISASSNASYQWQQDAGLGYFNLTNAGPYSGVTTNTLSISNVQLTMNNYQYHCIIYDSLGGCHNTSSSAALYVTGIKEIELTNYNIYPNPASTSITLELPFNFMKATETIYDVLGTKRFSETVEKPRATIDISSLPKGSYVIEVIADKKMRRQMFIKQ